MDSSIILTTTTTASSLLATSTPGIPDVEDNVPAHHANPVVAFIIGFAIVLLASILNAGGLNITKLDHVRTSAIPKASRRKDWLRPLWLLGMILYILSQLIGSTLALEYLRAEYVAPLGSSSLIFNFLFASLLIGTPVTNTDIYGTIIVIAGVVGIVLFGSINSGLETEMDISRLSSLWSRGNWILYFIFWSISLILLYIFASQLELILTSRSDISSTPFAGQGGSSSSNVPLSGLGWRTRFVASYRGSLMWIREKLELWTMTKDDKALAWTLGIAWACCGGGLAGGCLVFAKACVKMISGALSHVNTGNQFFHFAAIATFLFLAITAVFQIICLNRGLKVYDSTLVVPVFYGVYTASGFLNSLIFNNEIDQYKSWTLFLIFVSIFILISGVVLLTHKKPEPSKKNTSRGIALSATLPASKKPKSRRSIKNTGDHDDDDEAEDTALHAREDGEEEVMWELGQASDDEDADDNDVDHGKKTGGEDDQRQRRGLSASGQASGEEGRGLMQLNEDGTHDSEVW
ncbi:hypothetical protein SCHPADRAFT_833937 [Schizopora paradoxa]|uniref:DUF803-domain-containing protein n=1 Tax=Schizopora paradoxa TaxID=27342 RepID=A0A0H2RJ84_9AGAM|nr:hypothetical protein SCHPADRAFT_833937 [Schizopora paradoxa]